MVAFCTVEQYEARYGEVEDETVLEEIIKDASRKIAAECDRCRINWRDPDDPDYEDKLMQSCRDMAHRAFIYESADSSVPYGATNYSQSVDGFSENMSFTASGSSGYGDVFITKAERKLLGLYKRHIGQISLIPESTRCPHARR